MPETPSPRWQHILDTVTTLFEDYEFPIPIDIEQLAQALGIAVTHVPPAQFPRPNLSTGIFRVISEGPCAYAIQLDPLMRQMEHVLNPDAEAHTPPIGIDAPRYRIYTDDGNCRERQRFSIAHEIGHILLKHFTSQLPAKTQETEANYFASHLLIPRPALLFYQDQFEDVEHVAQLFDVSYEAASWAVSSMPNWISHEKQNLIFNERILSAIRANAPREISAQP